VELICNVAKLVDTVSKGGVTKQRNQVELMSNVTKQEETSHSTKRRNDKVSDRNKNKQLVRVCVCNGSGGTMVSNGHPILAKTGRQNG
jgi:hypothetical protein